jgi:RimJ/RimL family protein N-acetyltransferase
MNRLPTLKTQRLLLRPFTLEDSPQVQTLAGAWEVATTTANIPHPYENGMAEAWISTHQRTYEERQALTLAIEAVSDHSLMGAIGIRINQTNNWGEIGYWIGLPYWNRGFCTEAAEAMLRYGFHSLGLNRIQARHLTRNPASGRVMQKVGMAHEGTLRQSVFRWGRYEDIEMYAILREEFRGLNHA